MIEWIWLLIGVRRSIGIGLLMESGMVDACWIEGRGKVADTIGAKVCGE
ncbi:hypothetical protein IKF15_02585 [Candidatus Saccharibacteria bacterium]|nr:hypothetical protein [Candidatus Saccharibacteria bacterium]